MTVPTYKIIMVGDSTVGKSSILNYYINNSFQLSHNSTIGIDFKSKVTNINGKDIKLQIWDTAGQERFKSIVRSYYRSCHGAIVVFDMTVPKTLENVSNWLDEINNYMMPNCPIVLVGNKSDLYGDNPYHVNKKNIYKILETNTDIAYVETSARHGIMVNEIFITLIKKLLAIPRTKTYSILDTGAITFDEIPEKDFQRSRCYC